MAIEGWEVLGGLAMIATGIYFGLRHISLAIGQSFKELTEQAKSMTGNAEINLTTADVSATMHRRGTKLTAQTTS